MVFQEFDQLLPWKTVKQNVAFALRTSGKLAGRAADEKKRLPCRREGRADALCGRLSPHAVGRHEGAGRDCARPRHGARYSADGRAVRRVGRAVAAPGCRTSWLALWDETRFTILFVTHSISEAVLIGSRILLLVGASGPGQGGARIERPRRRPSADRARKLSDSIHRLLFEGSGGAAEEAGHELV